MTADGALTPGVRIPTPASITPTHRIDSPTATSSAVAATAEPTPRGPAYTNPVLNADFPDPTVMRASDGWYYAYATQTFRAGKMINMQVARSRDLVRWKHLGDALPAKPRWASNTQSFWAPHVIERAGSYYMYYSADPNTQDGLCLAVATAKKASGPFQDMGMPLQCGSDFVNIDPMPFDDPKSGKRLLYWGSGFEPIKVRELGPSRLAFAKGSKAVDLISPSSDPYERLVEGAWVVLRNGYYYMFYSGDNCCGEYPNYAVLVARSRSATGPFEKLGDVRGDFMSAILQFNEHWDAPGHNSIVTDAAGQDWLVYHAIDPDNRFNATDDPNETPVRRVMLVDRIVYENGWPRMQNGSPSRAPREVPTVR